MGSYNQFHPTVLGQEFPPVVSDPILLDTASSVGYRYTPINRDDVQMVRLQTVDPLPGQALRKCITADIYPVGASPSTGVVRTMLIPVASGTLGSGAANSGGATVADCVKNPSDTAYTSLTGAASSVRLWFDVTASRVSRALTNARILDVTVRYAITGPFDTLPNGLVLALERPSASKVFDMDDALTGPTNNYDNVVPHRSRLGDLNPFWASGFDPTTAYERVPWHYAAGINTHTGMTALAASGGTNINVQFHTSAGAAGLEFRIQYIALEVTYCAESRVAAGGLELTAGAALKQDLFSWDINVGSMGSLYGGEGVTLRGFYYNVVVGQGYCGALSVAHPVPIAIPRLSAGQIYPPHRGIAITKTLREGETWTAEETDAIPALVMYAEDVSPGSSNIIYGSQVYVEQLATSVDATVATTELQARLVDDVAATYPFVRFYARVQPATAAELTVLQVTSLGAAVGPSATITVDELEDLTEINDGWRRVTLEWDTPVVTTGTGLVYISFSTEADTGAPWEILGADANPADVADQDVGIPTYGDTTAKALIDSTADYTADLTVMLVQDMPVPADLVAGTAIQPLSLVDESCDVPVAGIPTGIRYITLTWDTDNSPAVAGFAWYEVQRRDTTMDADVWETVATITQVSQGEVADYEARIGVVSSYRVRFVHVDGYTSDWSNTATATVLAPGVTGTTVSASVLVLTSNHNPDSNVAHVMTWDGSGVPAQEFAFPEGGQTVLQPMYQRDYRVAFRPLERAGVEFTRTFLVNSLGVPPQTLSDGFSGLRDLAWDDLPYVCVRDEQANRWLTAVSVPSGTVRDIPNAGHLMLAQVSFAEVTATPAPIDYAAVCEGAMLTGRDNFLNWRTTTGSNILQGVLDAQDTFTRTVSAGSWGTADTGETYTLNTPSGGSVNGTRGVLTVASAATNVSARMSGVRDFYRATNQVVLPALATGNTYKVTQLFHCQDQVAYTDDFTRTVSNGWGTATTGQVYTVDNPTSMSTTGTRGRITMATVGEKAAYFDYGISQCQMRIGRLALNAAVTGASGVVEVHFSMARNTSGDTRITLKLFFGTTGTISYLVSLVRLGVEIDVSTPADTGLTSGTALAVHWRVNGYRVQASVWQNGTTEPSSFVINEDLSDQPGTGTWLLFSAGKNASVTNATMFCEFDDISIVNTDGFNCYRSDLVLKTDGTMSMDLVSRVSNLDYVMETNTVAGTYTANTVVNFDSYSQGYSLESRIWRVGDAEPDHFGANPGSCYSFDFRQQAVHGGGQFGVRASRDSGNTNANLAPQYDNLNIYQLPIEFDVRFLIRPVADDWSFAFNAYSDPADVAGYTGEWRAELSNTLARFLLGGADPGTLDINPQPIYKNQLIWVRFNYKTDDGTGLGLFTLYTSLDGVSWSPVEDDYDTSPAAPPAIPADGTMEVQMEAPADSVWIHEMEIRVDGQLLYDPDFSAQPPGTTSFADTEGNVWTGEAALCADQ